MSRRDRRTIRFRGREQRVLETFHVRGRNYFSLEQLSRRGAFRVFDPHAAPGGDYRVLYRLPASKTGRQTIETLRRLTGPTANRNFPHIVDCTRVGGDLFVVTSWVWGTNLREYFRAVREAKTPRPSVSEVVRLMRGLAHGIGHYHRKMNLVHGDISPANIVVTAGTKHLVLVDFGSAWPVEDTAVKQAGDGVTQPYAAPERLAKHAVEDFRSDIFSLSVVAYEMLTLELPFDGLGGQAGLPNLVEQAARSYRSPSKLIDKIGRLPSQTIQQLDGYFRSGLALHPDQRFGTRTDFLSAWDGLHDSLRKGNRLTRMEKVLLRGFDTLARLLRRWKG